MGLQLPGARGAADATRGLGLQRQAGPHDPRTWLGTAPAGRAAPNEVVLRYLCGFGPASVKDVQTWSGLTPLRGCRCQRGAAGTLLRLGAADLGHVATRESLRWAAMAPDPLRDAAMRLTLVYVLIWQGRWWRQRAGLPACRVASLAVPE